MSTPLEVSPVHSRRDLQAFVRFPWQVYRGDRNWVPPLISDRLHRLDPAHNPFFAHAEVELFLARRSGRVVGTIAAFVDHRRNERYGERIGGFGFFEVIDDYAIAEALLDAACRRVREWGMQGIRGPTNFGMIDEPGVLIAGADCPPALLEAHTPPYYREFLERYGMVKYRDQYAWRVSLPDLGRNLERIPEQAWRVFEAARTRGDVRVRKLRLEDWDSEVALVHELYNTCHRDVPDHMPMTPEAFRRFANRMRPLLDPDLVLFVELDGKPVGFFVAIPDFNRVLWRMNGRLWPLGWLKMLWYRRRIDQISFKLLGVLEEYRRQGLDVLMWLEAVRIAAAKGYRWLDGSLTSELNTPVVRLAERLGAERYKHYRLYQMLF